MSDRNSVDILIDVIREQATLARETSSRLEALEKSVDGHVSTLNSIQAMLDDRDKKEAERARRENAVAGFFRKALDLPAVQFTLLAAAFWFASRIGVLQDLLGVQNAPVP